ncbi:MAG: Sir2 silent information regulator family NAD-dependent deacetylase [Clostridia bacterium]|nr:Sir2 silent information regulator family NAD-dependent deacetylase [Clostridia bacterium]
MSSKMRISRSTGNCSDNINKLREALSRSEAVVIGAGAGLSTSAGFTYSGERFEKYFSDFREKYGFTDMYSGGFYPYPSKEEFWGYWSRYILINRYMDAPKPVYNELLALVKDKDYFVITTNVDHCFQKAGFDKKRLFYTQGDYGLFQCTGPCCNETFDNREMIVRMVEGQKDGKVPPELFPKCPNCGRPLTLNLRSDDSFIEDYGWVEAAQRYDQFLREHEGNRVLFLELGVGFNTPSIIKYPFWRMTLNNPNATYACVNYGESFTLEEIADRSVCIDGDIGETIRQLQ